MLWSVSLKYSALLLDLIISLFQSNNFCLKN